MQTGNYDQEVAERIADTRRESEEAMLGELSVYPTMVKLLTKYYGSEGTKEGLSQTHRILVGLGIAVARGSQSAIEYHVTRATNHGATSAMIRDAIDCALLNEGGMAVSSARFALNALNARQMRPRKS